MRRTGSKKRTIDYFREWDSDQSGALSFDEFKEAIFALGVVHVSPSDLLRTFAAFDVDQSGSIDYSELSRVLLRLPRVRPQAPAPRERMPPPVRATAPQYVLPPRYPPVAHTWLDGVPAGQPWTTAAQIQAGSIWFHVLKVRFSALGTQIASEPAFAQLTEAAEGGRYGLRFSRLTKRTHTDPHMDAPDDGAARFVFCVNLALRAQAPVQQPLPVPAAPALTSSRSLPTLSNDQPASTHGTATKTANTDAGGHGGGTGGRGAMATGYGSASPPGLVRMLSNDGSRWQARGIVPHAHTRQRTDIHKDVHGAQHPHACVVPGLGSPVGNSTGIGAIATGGGTRAPFASVERRAARKRGDGLFPSSEPPLV